METVTPQELRLTEDSQPPSPEERGIEALEEAATAPRDDKGKPEVSGETERTALDFLLSPPKRLEYKVPVSIDTEGGEKTLDLIVRSLPGQQLRDIERRNSKDGTLGPLAELDDQRIAAETVSAALVRIEDPRSGGTLDPRDPRFMQNSRGEKIIDPVTALAARFEFQSGILSNVASEVRRISGYSSDRVGTAQRVMVDAVGSSSNGAD